MKPRTPPYLTEPDQRSRYTGDQRQTQPRFQHGHGEQHQISLLTSAGQATTLYGIWITGIFSADYSPELRYQLYSGLQ